MEMVIEIFKMTESIVPQRWETDIEPHGNIEAINLALLTCLKKWESELPGLTVKREENLLIVEIPKVFQTIDSVKYLL